MGEGWKDTRGLCHKHTMYQLIMMVPWLLMYSHREGTKVLFGQTGLYLKGDNLQYGTKILLAIIFI